MTKTKAVKVQNERLAEALGRMPSGEARFQWFHSTQLFYFYQIEGKTKVIEPPEHQKLAIVMPVYQRISWADRKGPCWMLACWRKPLITKQEWEHQIFGSEFPYPGAGQYYYIDGTEIGAEPPGKDETDFVIWAIKQQLSVRPEVHIYEAKRAREREDQRRIDEMTDEALEVLPVNLNGLWQGHSLT